MGYSCTAIASFTLDGVKELSNSDTSNAMPGGGFWEIGKEQRDGSITGSVWRPLNAEERARWAHLPSLDTRVIRAGSFKISAQGKILRFPGLTKAQRQSAEQYGTRRNQEVFS